jgi:hypothetical protein
MAAPRERAVRVGRPPGAGIAFGARDPHCTPTAGSGHIWKLIGRPTVPPNCALSGDWSSLLARGVGDKDHRVDTSASTSCPVARRR